MTEPQKIMTICSEKSSFGIPSRKSNCVECKTPIFLSLSTIERAMEISDNVELTPFCFECGTRYREENDIPMVPLSEKQIEEIKKGIK